MTRSTFRGREHTAIVTEDEHGNPVRVNFEGRQIEGDEAADIGTALRHAVYAAKALAPNVDEPDYASAIDAVLDAAHIGF